VNQFSLEGILREATVLVSYADVVCTRERPLNDLVARLRADTDGVDSMSSYVRLPIIFDNTREEVNFHALLSLLRFGTGYDPLLLEHVARDARECAQFGLLGFHLGGKKIDTNVMCNYGALHVLDMMGVDGKQDREIAPGVYAQEPGPLAGYVERIVRVLNRTGAQLRGLEKGDLGEFVLDYIDQTDRPTAAGLVDHLITLTGFGDDRDEPCKGVEVSFHSKAQELAVELYLRFRQENPKFDFPDADLLVGHIDNHIPAVLTKLGVIAIGPTWGWLETRIAEGEALDTTPVEPGTVQNGGAGASILRAAAMVIIDTLSKRCEGLRPWQAARWLADLPKKDETLTDLKKFLVQDTTSF